jgi:release factor glutamine methyltransferase
MSALDLVREATEALQRAGADSPRLDAELFLAEALGSERFRLYLEPKRRVTAEERSRFEELVHRRARREPAAYILGRKEFWSLELRVGPGVLVPRPETECLIEAALQRLAGRRLGTVLDLGCGAAPLAIALALNLDLRRVIAVDRSIDALRYARDNVRRHSLQGRVFVLAADLLDGLAPAALAPVDLIVSNPPYIPSAAVANTMPEVSIHEPREALDGGPSGLELTERLLRSGRAVLARSGAILVETGDGLMSRLMRLARRLGYKRLDVVRDLAGRPRALWAEAPG